MAENRLVWWRRTLKNDAPKKEKRPAMSALNGSDSWSNARWICQWSRWGERVAAGIFGFIQRVAAWNANKVSHRPDLPGRKGARDLRGGGGQLLMDGVCSATIQRYTCETGIQLASSTVGFFWEAKKIPVPALCHEFSLSPSGRKRALIGSCMNMAIRLAFFGAFCFDWWMWWSHAAAAAQRRSSCTQIYPRSSRRQAKRARHPSEARPVNRRLPTNKNAVAAIVIN